MESRKDDWKKFKNAIFGTVFLLVVITGIALFLRFGLAISMNAGTEGFFLSEPFLGVQAAGYLLFFWLFYIRVNRETVDITQISKMKENASGNRWRYLLKSLIFSGLTAVAAIILMFGGILFIGIPSVYCLTASVVMTIFGNLGFLIAAFVFVPNRVTGSY